MDNYKLSMIINYINDNFYFGSKVNIKNIEELCSKYDVSDEENKLIFEELNSLNIEIIGHKEAFNDKINKLFKYIGQDKELCELDLNQWFKNEKIDYDKKNRICDILDDLGYTIVGEGNQKVNNQLDFLDELNYEDLDEILESKLFNDEFSKIKTVIDKTHNLEYLNDIYSSEKGSKKNEEALDNLINANKKLVWKIVLRYKQFSTVALDINDMYQVGMIGLFKAVEKFDINKGNKFSTYAIWWIRQSITRNIADYSTTIRIPVHMREKIAKYIDNENKFWVDNGRLGSEKEIAKIMNVDEKEVNNLKIYRLLGNLTSLDLPIGTEENSFIGEFIADDKNELPDRIIEEKALKAEIEKIFKKELTPRELKVLKFRFGFVEEKLYTLQEIGHIEKVTRERIRQIESNAIRKLKKSKILERLKDFYYDRE